MSAARNLLKVDHMNASRSLNRFAVPFVASFALASLVGCGGNLTGNGAGGTSGSELPGVAGNVGASTGGLNSSGTGTGPATGCTPRDCEGLAVTDDAKICPDGTGLGRTVCAMRANGTCGWHFPDCPSGPGVADASTGPVRPLNGPCPPVQPHNPGMFPGPCSLVGRWFLKSSHGTVRSMGVIEFDADGSYYGGANLSKPIPLAAPIPTMPTAPSTYSIHVEMGAAARDLSISRFKTPVRPRLSTKPSQTAPATESQSQDIMLTRQ